MMFKGFETREIGMLLSEYKQLCQVYDVDKRGWLSFKDYLIFRTGIGLEKEMKLYKVKQRLDDIEEDFKDE